MIKGPGRPKKNEAKKRTFMQRTLLLAETKKRLQKHADRTGLTESDIIRLALNDWFMKMDKKQP